jgi:hypothetical protein
MAKNVVIPLSGGLPIYIKKICQEKHVSVRYAVKNLNLTLLNKKQHAPESAKEFTFQS